MRGPCDGFYINFTKVPVTKNTSEYSAFCKYDGSTSVQAGSYPVKICTYNSTGAGYINFTMIVGDDSSASSLDDKYDELNKLLSKYRQSDFTNSEIYDEAA
jgi:hypothetical protein